MEKKIVNDLNEAKENDIVYDIDFALELLKEFIKKTFIHTKDFKKLSKKMNGKDKEKQEKELHKFCKEKLLNQWNYIFSSKFYSRNELENIEDKILYTYILGVFISGHSELPNIKNNINKILANSIYELTERVYGR